MTVKTQIHCKDKKTALARKATYDKCGNYKTAIVAGKAYPPYYLVLEMKRGKA
jgi:hypothetical protein